MKTENIESDLKALEGQKELIEIQQNTLRKSIGTLTLQYAELEESLRIKNIQIEKHRKEIEKHE